MNATDDTDLRGARALREWVTGEPREYARVFLVESGASAETLHGCTSPDDVVLLPAESEGHDGPAQTVRYTGSLNQIGDELYLGARGVELQDYIAAAFVQILGPTVVRFADEASWHAFLDDAELARHTGVFPTALTDPRVLLADRGALMHPAERRRPSAIRVGSGGRIGIGVHGASAVGGGQLAEVLAEPRPGVLALDGIASETDLIADLARHPWLPRYLTAIELVKMLRLTDGESTIAGFGWSPLADGGSDAEPLRADPFLLRTPDGFVLADTTTLRRQLLPPATAMVVAATQTSTTLARAADRTARLLGIAVQDARALCRQAIQALNVHPGSAVHRSTTAEAVG